MGWATFIWKHDCVWFKIKNLALVGDIAKHWLEHSFPIGLNEHMTEITRDVFIVVLQRLRAVIHWFNYIDKASAVSYYHYICADLVAAINLHYCARSARARLKAISESVCIQ